MNATPALTAPTDASGRPVRLGLRESWLQFSLLVAVNAAVGGLVGLERTTVPLIGADTFGLTDYPWPCSPSSSPSASPRR